VFTHYHRDHVGGISGALRGRNVQRFIATGYHEPKEQFDYVLREIPAGIPQLEVSASQQYSLGGMGLRVLWPARYIRAGSMPNNASVVVLASLEGRRILLTGDIMREVTSVDVDVVKVPHHGSANLDPGFSEWAGAEIALISVGEDNDYGHRLVQPLTSGVGRGSTAPTKMAR
jgi:competence protein ComEC